jgi:leader peptidase (prepilin peptidase)/N-methyltransferase
MILWLVLGACVGSFLNVCIYRLPRRKSLIFPPSHCPQCEKRIRPYDNIPLLSFLLLRGKCRFCRGRIHPRYFIVELLTTLLFGFLYLKYGISGEFFIYLILGASLVVIAFIDFENQIIPDKITYPGIILGLIFNARGLPHSFEGLKLSLLGIAWGGGLLYLVALASRGNMGGGDIKLGAMLGAFLGWKYALLSLFAAFLFGSIVGIILILLKLKTRKDHIPFGPYVVAGAIVSIFWGEKILYWYENIRW